MIKAKDDKNKPNQYHIAYEALDWKSVIGIILAFIFGFIVGLHFYFNPLLGK